MFEVPTSPEHRVQRHISIAGADDIIAFQEVVPSAYIIKENERLDDDSRRFIPHGVARTAILSLMDVRDECDPRKDLADRITEAYFTEQHIYDQEQRPDIMVIQPVQATAQAA